MTVRDLLEVYQIVNYSENITGLWEDMTCDIDSRIDRSLLYTSMLEDVGALEPRYTVCEEFKRFSEEFFNRNNAIFTRRIDALEAQYNIVYDYDMETIEHKKRDLSEKTNIDQKTTSVTDMTSVVDTDSKTDSTSDSNGTGVHTTSAYNSDEYQPRDKTDSNAENSSNSHDISKVSGESNTDNKGTMLQDTAHGLEEGNDLGRHEYGRKGDAQRLIQAELELAEQMDIYAYIIDMYSRRLCLNVF